MKLTIKTTRQRAKQSLPVRGAWIEIGFWLSNISVPERRSPCGERGLKFTNMNNKIEKTRRSPCGERGLKLYIKIM